MPEEHREFHGAGLGLRRALLGPLAVYGPGSGRLHGSGAGELDRCRRSFRQPVPQLAERYPLVLHGLSLDIGGPDPIDTDLVGSVRDLMDEVGSPLYSEHLTYCAAEGHLYDLLPIPFTEEAVHYVAGRVRQVQDIIGAPIALENASYYAQPHTELQEAEFICGGACGKRLRPAAGREQYLREQH